MPNTLTNINDVRVAQAALQPFMQGVWPISAFSTNFSAEAADRGDTIRVPIVGAPTASSDFTGDYTTGAAGTITSTPVTLNRHKYKTVSVTAKEQSNTSVQVLENLIVGAAQQLAIDVLNDILSNVTAANYGAAPTGLSGLATSAFNYTKLLAAREACGAVNMPSAPRTLILNPSFYTQLLADDVVAKSFNLNLSASGVEDAVVRRVAGFNIMEAIGLPALGAEKLAGFACHPSSMAVAMRYLQPLANYEASGAVTDPASGMTFGFLRYSDVKSGMVYYTIEALYGFTTGIANGLKRITSA